MVFQYLKNSILLFCYPSLKTLNIIITEMSVNVKKFLLEIYGLLLSWFHLSRCCAIGSFAHLQIICKFDFPLDASQSTCYNPDKDTKIQGCCPVSLNPESCIFCILYS